MDKMKTSLKELEVYADALAHSIKMYNLKDKQFEASREKVKELEGLLQELKKSWSTLGIVSYGQYTSDKFKNWKKRVEKALKGQEGEGK